MRGWGVGLGRNMGGKKDGVEWGKNEMGKFYGK
jgi:hypothetical protein